MTVPPLPPNAALRWSVVRRTLRRLAPATVLEIGCGQGAFGARLARRSDYLAVEPDPTSYAVARTRIEPAGGTVRNSGFEGLLAEGRTFDLVCSFEVLEHFEDDVAVLEQWRGLVKPGGHLLLSMPAWQERFNRWDAMVGHYRRYSPQSARAALTAGGFDDVQVIVYGWPLGFATENVRVRIAERRGTASEDGRSADPVAVAAGADSGEMADRTARSGRLLQPRSVAGRAVHGATLPFAALQRLRPDSGTGVVVLARRPL